MIIHNPANAKCTKQQRHRPQQDHHVVTEQRIEDIIALKEQSENDYQEMAFPY